MNRKVRIPALLLAYLAATHAAAAARLVSLSNQPPAAVGVPILLTDGGVMFPGNEDARTWWKLTPDAYGRYEDGLWTALASFPEAWNYAPFAFASAVLADGRVLVVGGEYNPPEGPFALTNKGAIYDPVLDEWTQVPPPPGWDHIGDSASIVMPNGKFLLGDKLTERIAELDPATMAWTALGSLGKSGFNAEEGWTLLPDGTFLAVDVHDAPNTEQYFYADAEGAGEWMSLGPTPVSLMFDYDLDPVMYPGGVYDPPGETGQCMLRPDRTVFCTGASDGEPGHRSHTAIFSIDAMQWSAGPDFPEGEDTGDTSAALLPSGHVLVSAVSGTLYEFDGARLTVTGHAGGWLLPLPSGQVLVSGRVVSLYTPDASPAADPAWAPAIAQWPSRIARGESYPISGTQLNGLSQAQAFGDECQAPTNYPLVRIVNRASGRVAYARTHDHSTMGVATGDDRVSTMFDVPSEVELGASDLEVVANGIVSSPVAVFVMPAAGHSRHPRAPR